LRERKEPQPARRREQEPLAWARPGPELPLEGSSPERVLARVFSPERALAKRLWSRQHQLHQQSFE